MFNIYYGLTSFDALAIQTIIRWILFADNRTTKDENSQLA